MPLRVRIYLTPLGLFVIYLISLFILPRLGDCTAAAGEWTSCMILGADFTGFMNSSIGIGFVMAPLLLLWLVLGGIVLWLLAIAEGRKGTY